MKLRIIVALFGAILFTHITTFSRCVDGERVTMSISVANNSNNIIEVVAKNKNCTMGTARDRSVCEETTDVQPGQVANLQIRSCVKSARLVVHEVDNRGNLINTYEQSRTKNYKSGERASFPIDFIRITR